MSFVVVGHDCADKSCLIRQLETQSDTIRVVCTTSHSKNVIAQFVNGSSGIGKKTCAVGTDIPQIYRDRIVIKTIKVAVNRPNKPSKIHTIIDVLYLRCGVAAITPV